MDVKPTSGGNGALASSRTCSQHEPPRHPAVRTDGTPSEPSRPRNSTFMRNSTWMAIGSHSGEPSVTMRLTRSGRRVARSRAMQPPRLCPMTATCRRVRPATASSRRSSRCRAAVVQSVLRTMLADQLRYPIRRSHLSMTDMDASPVRYPGTRRTGSPVPCGTPTPTETGSRRRAPSSSGHRDSSRSGGSNPFNMDERPGLSVRQLIELYRSGVVWAISPEMSAERLDAPGTLAPAVERGVQELLKRPVRKPRERLQLQRIEETNVSCLLILDAKPRAVTGGVDADEHRRELVHHLSDPGGHQTRNANVDSARSLSTSITFLRTIRKSSPSRRSVYSLRPAQMMTPRSRDS